jgi:fumarylacetoacetase
MLQSWLKIAENSDFPIQNLPYGIFSVADKKPRLGVAIGDYILDLKKTAKYGFFKDLKLDTKVFGEKYLNDFIALGKSTWHKVRQRLTDLLKEGNSPLKLYAEKVLIPMAEATMHLPIKIGDYTDFYSSIEHATNVGSMFRDPQNALLPNWRHLPVAYHGRASSIVISGTKIYRPSGQTKPANAEKPIFHASHSLDFELEMAFIIGKANELGTSISPQQAENHIFGLVLFNDWSARDIQAWEYVPLGPFLAKNFASAMSPWVVTLEALEPFRCASPAQEPEVLPYLQSEGEKTFDIQLEVAIKPQNTEEKTVCRSNFKYLYWNMSQQLAHHTINGCNMQVGDLCASGTISGTSPDSYGSMLELTWRGTKPLEMNDGTPRKFIDDFDTVIMRAFCEKNGLRIGFGEVRNKILPAKTNE